jgi:hypothetical protein
MTTNKALKRDVRARMEKTGESYTTARHYLLDQHLTNSSTDGSSEAPVEKPALPPRVADPGMSDEAIKRGTGKTWDELFLELDAWGASERTHPEIAVYAQQTFGISGWWAQGVTVGYERARGMRSLHERTDGYSANVSRTFGVPLEQLYVAVSDDDQRTNWLDPKSIRVRSATANKAWRCEMVEDDSRVEFRFSAKSPEKTSIAIEQTRLASESDVSRWRGFWKERLDDLGKLVSEN